MKIILQLLIASCIFCFVCAAQQTSVSVPVYERGWPERRAGLLYLPPGYNNSAGRYPVILFNHGSATSSLGALAAQGLPQQLANGMQLQGIVNPADKKSYSFIVLSLLHADPSSFPSQIRWLKQNYRIDTSRIYLTGLSMGGLTAMLGITGADSTAKLVAAAVLMSTPPPVPNMNYDQLQTHKIATWHISGRQDGFTQEGAAKYVARANAAFPNSSWLTLFNGGHCCWQTYYDIAFKDAALGMNIYEWMLQYKKKAPLQPMKYKWVKLSRG